MLVGQGNVLVLPRSFVVAPKQELMALWWIRDAHWWFQKASCAHWWLLGGFKKGLGDYKKHLGDSSKRIWSSDERRGGAKKRLGCSLVGFQETY